MPLQNREVFLALGWHDVRASRPLTPADQPRSLGDVARRMGDKGWTFDGLARTCRLPVQRKFFWKCSEIDAAFDLEKFGWPILRRSNRNELNQTPLSRYYLLDGNHRTLVYAMRLLRGEEYLPVEAFVDSAGHEARASATEDVTCLPLNAQVLRCKLILSGNCVSNLIFSARDNQTANLGTPPHVTNADNSVYVGYFENDYGEQWVFTYDRKSRRAELRGGDLEWGRRVEVSNHEGLPDIGDLILSEFRGLVGCMRAGWRQSGWAANSAAHTISAFAPASFRTRPIRPLSSEPLIAAGLPATAVGFSSRPRRFRELLNAPIHVDRLYPVTCIARGQT